MLNVDFGGYVEVIICYEWFGKESKGGCNGCIIMCGIDNY